MANLHLSIAEAEIRGPLKLTGQPADKQERQRHCLRKEGGERLEKTLDIVRHGGAHYTFNPSTWEAGAGGSL